MKRILIIMVLMILIPNWAIARTQVLEDWDSPEELQAFLAQDDTDSHIVLRCNSQGIAKLNGICEDRAFQLRDNAMAQGKYLSVFPLDRTEYHKWYGVWLKSNQYHMICGAKVGDNEFWYIEPGNDKCWLAQYLD